MAQALQLFFVDLGFFKDAGQQRGEQVHLLPQSGLAPGAKQGGADVAIHQRHRNLLLFGEVGGGGQFGPRLDSRLQSHALLVGSQGQVRHQKGRLAFFDDLDDIERFPLVAVAQGLQALGVEFYADGVGVFRFNDLPDLVDGSLGDVGGADQDNFLVGQLDT